MNYISRASVLCAIDRASNNPLVRRELKEVRDIVNLLPSVAERMDNWWRPVDERLPPSSGFYLVALTLPSKDSVAGRVKRDNLCGVCYYNKDVERFVSVGWGSWQPFGFVDPECITHWRPLPEPPDGLPSLPSEE